MSAFTFTDPTNVTNLAIGDLKIATVTVTGPTSYDTGGSTIDLSGIFAKVHGAMLMSASTAALSKHKGTFLPGASFAAATGKIKLNDITAASGAEVSSTTDLSGGTYTLLVVGK